MLDQLPKWVIRFLELTCSATYFDELLGDLLELFQRELKQLGLKKARKNFTRRALLSIRWYRLPKIHQFPTVMLFKNYYKVAVRHAFKHKSASTIHSLGLTLGLAAAFYIGLFIQNEFYYDSMHENADQLYRVLQHNPNTGERGHSTSSLHGMKLEEEFAFLEASRFGNDPVKLGEVNPKLVEDFYWADANFFDFFTFQFLEGDPQTCLANVNSIVLTESLCQQLFGTTQAVGKSIKTKIFDGDQEYLMQVTGVIKDPSKYSHIQFEALGSMQNAEVLYKDLVAGWFFNWLRTYVKIPKDKLEEVEAGIPRLVQNAFGDQVPPGFGIQFQAFDDVYLKSQDIPRNTFQGDIQNIRIFGIVGLLIVLISLMNYVNLATARAISRSKEIGIRKVLGSKKGAILWQFIIESLLFTFGSGLAAILLLVVLLPYLNQLLNLDLSLQILGWLDILQLFFFILFVGIIAGILPAIAMSKLPFITQQRNHIQFKVNNWSMTRKFFVGIQYFIAIGLLVASIVIHRQYEHLRNYDLGFDPQQLIHIPVDDRTLQEKLPSIKEKITSISGISAIAATGEDLPSQMNNRWRLQWPGMDPSLRVGMDVIGIDQDYFDLLEIPFIEGQNFQNDIFTDSTRSVILNTQAQQRIGEAAKVGQFIKIEGRPRKIVGIVEDYHNTSLHSEIIPIMYLMFPPGLRVSPDNLLAKVETKDLPRIIKELESAWGAFSPDPLVFNFVDEAFEQAYQSEKHFSILIGSFTFVAICISMIGLFGLISFIVQLKRKEISIRRVLGASPISLLQLLGREFFLLFLVAAIVASPVAYFVLNNWLESYIYRIDINLSAFLPALIVCLLVSSLVILYHLQRTTRLNPAEVINRD